ncbi:hypothetical protein NE237_029040 [Protea cynaroides]|uniref:Phospho-2-dehydro-3-deoxyheptonate aldolase n=1 Tax=Protea cynaroides TaxID=273540 RepID=A0A9Q0GT67_9MAGN|nr:hypothetical protein NE237_029040 [Protea cynaroides]
MDLLKFMHQRFAAVLCKSVCGLPFCSRAEPANRWTLDGWKSKKALQIPVYPNQQELDSVLKTLEGFPRWCLAGEARKFEERLAKAALGEAFLPQGGDCAESFQEFSANNIRDTLFTQKRKTLGTPSGFFCRWGRLDLRCSNSRHQGRKDGWSICKPRSDPFEIGEVKLPSYQGDNINSDTFDEKSRTPDPHKLIRAYTQSAGTLNLLRSFATGGYAAMQRVKQWNLDFTEHSEQGDRYKETAQRIDESLGFMIASGLTMDHPVMTTIEFWMSHECLHLPYEQAMTREDSTTGL